jgi:hypothetical protein
MEEKLTTLSFLLSLLFSSTLWTRDPKPAMVSLA